MIVAILAVVAAVAIGVAFYKHKTLAGVVASAKKEVAYLETLAKAEAAVAKSDLDSVIARLKLIF